MDFSGSLLSDSYELAAELELCASFSLPLSLSPSLTRPRAQCCCRARARAIIRTSICSGDLFFVRLTRHYCAARRCMQHVFTRKYELRPMRIMESPAAAPEIRSFTRKLMQTLFARVNYAVCIHIYLFAACSFFPSRVSILFFRLFFIPNEKSNGDFSGAGPFSAIQEEAILICFPSLSRLLRFRV